MRMKRLLILLSVMLALTAAAQQPDDLRRQFEELKNSRRKAYDDFRAQCNADFAEALRQEWSSFPAQPAEKAPLTVAMPRPVTLPGDKQLQLPNPDPRANLAAIGQIANAVLPVDIAVERSGSATDLSETVVVRELHPAPVASAVVFNFYGNRVVVPWEGSAEIRLASADEAGFSRLWSTLAAAPHQAAVDFLTDYCTLHRLNGWATYQLVKKFTERVCPDDRPDERIALQAFLLSQLKFKAQVAAHGNRLVLLLPFSEELYEVPYLTINNTRHYIYAYTPVTSDGEYRTCVREFAYADRQLSLVMDGRMKIGIPKEVELSRWSVLLGEKFTVPTDFGIISLLYDYPSVEAQVRYRQGLSTAFSERILSVLRRKTSALSETEKVAYLLNLVQHGFAYESDASLFGRPKPLFIEESFFYGRNNAKDRAAIFAWLVKQVAQLDTVLVSYENSARNGGHIACAVAFTSEVGGLTVNHRNKRYVVCDPTCINAGIGMLTPDYAGIEGVVLRL